MFFKRLSIGIYILCFIGCGTVESYNNESNQNLNTEQTTLIEVAQEPLDTSTPSPIPSKKPLEPIVDNSDLDSNINSNSSQSSSIDNILNSTPIVENGNISSTIEETIIENNTTIVTVGFREKFINSSRCNQIIDKEFFVICYDFKLKSAKSVAYTLEGDLVNKLDIEDRPLFYEEELIDKPYRVKYSDYIGSGYNRGHLAPDASFDWSIESLEATYSLANIIPQAPIVNQEMWVNVEQYARDKAVELGELDIVNVVKFSSKPKYIGEDKIAISDGYYKILYNQDKGYEECFYYANDLNISSIDDNLSKHTVNCGDI